MKSSSILVAALTLLGPVFAAQTPLPEHPREILAQPLAPYTPPRPAEHELANGTPVLLLVNRELPLVDGRLRVRTGSLHEAPELTGLTSVLVEALRGGGAGGEHGLTGAELETWLDAHGAELAITTGLDEIEIAFSCLRADLPRLLELLGALLAEPLYPPDDVERAVLMLRTEIARRDDDAGATADRLLMQVVHGADSPFARVASQKTAGNIDREAVLAFHREHIGTGRLLVGLAGDFAIDEALALLEGAFGELAAVEPPPELPSPSFRLPARTSVFVHDRPGVPQTQVRMAAPGVRRLDEDAAALRLFTLAVGAGGFTNRMMLRVRTELGLAYDVGAAFSPGWERRGYFTAWTATRNEAVTEAVAAMLAVLRGGLQPLGTAELESARARDAQYRLADFLNPASTLDRALDLAFHGYPAAFWDTYARRLREVSAEQIAEAAARHLDPGRLVIVAVGPAERLVAELAAFGPVERLDVRAEEPSAGDAEARLDALLAAVGTREAWAAARFLEVHARIAVRVGDDETSFEARTWQDLDGPRLRVVNRVDGVDTFLVLTPDGARLRRGDVLQAVSGAQHEDLMVAARTDLFRLLHLAARGEGVVRAEGERSLVLRGPGEDEPELLVELDERNLPIRASGSSDGAQYRFEGWSAGPTGLGYPARIHRTGPDTRLREITRFEAHLKLDEGLFEKP